VLVQIDLQALPQVLDAHVALQHMDDGGALLV
jgi:hypothetical protein